MVIVSEEGELRVSIYSVFPIRKSLPVSNPDTTVCARIDTPNGPLAGMDASLEFMAETPSRRLTFAFSRAS